MEADAPTYARLRAWAGLERTARREEVRGSAAIAARQARRSGSPKSPLQAPLKVYLFTSLAPLASLLVRINLKNGNKN
jgi:hypothetical protein